MFAGVTSIIPNKEHTEVLDVSCKKGEQVILASDRRINDCLPSVEQQIRVILATSLAKFLEGRKGLQC